MITKEALDALNEDLQAAENRKGDYLASIQSAAGTVAGWVEESKEREQDPPYYWDMMNEYDDRDLVNHVYPYDQDTARIISQEDGGVIAYVHKDMADKIVTALWIAA
jgi:hypothetical protein